MKLKSLNKKGVTITEIIIGLILIGVIIFAIVIPIKNRWNEVHALATNFTPMQKDFSDTFPFLANKLEISKDSIGCTEILDSNTKSLDLREWNCENSKEIIFSSSVTYYGSKLRNMRAGVLICKGDIDNCCDTMYINTYTAYFWSSKYVNIIPNDETIVNFELEIIKDASGNPITAGTYKIHPITECKFDSKVGCKVSGMTQSAKSCNANNYILVNIV
jgi:hypothetical protein